MKISDNNKVNHFVNNLALVSNFNEEYKELHKKVLEVKEEVSFRIFCIHNFDNDNQSVDTLKNYFIINK